jgi:hypothetical protein
VHLESSPLHDAITSSHCLASSWYVQPSLVQMSTILIITLHSLLTHYSSIRRWRSGRQCFPSFKLQEEENGCCLDLNLIPSTFLEATSAISIPPYLENLANWSENMITLS